MQVVLCVLGVAAVSTPKFCNRVAEVLNELDQVAVPAATDDEETPREYGARLVTAMSPAETRRFVYLFARRVFVADGFAGAAVDEVVARYFGEPHFAHGRNSEPTAGTIAAVSRSDAAAWCAVAMVAVTVAYVERRDAVYRPLRAMVEVGLTRRGLVELAAERLREAPSDAQRIIVARTLVVTFLTEGVEARADAVLEALL